MDNTTLISCINRLGGTVSLSLVPRPFQEEEKGPGTHCLRMCHVFCTTHRKITHKLSAYMWIKMLTSEMESKYKRVWVAHLYT